jgi:hypothetical protein
MPTFIQLLEELAQAEKTITIPAGEVERLASRFGDQVRHMGRWNAGGDGSLEIPVSVVCEAATHLGSKALVEAVHELKTESLTKMFNTSSAVSLIEKIAEAYRRHFRDLMTRYQDTKDPAETARLRDRLVGEVFGE